MFGKPAFWQYRGWISTILLPLSFIYGAVVRLKSLCYSYGWCKSKKLPVPVLVIGNIVAGGAGKTPVVMAIAQFLLKQNIKVGIISRGYKGELSNKRKAVEVLLNSLASQVGDEPLLLKKKLAVPVFICPNRYLAGKKLLEKYADVQVILSDDGLQHLALVRDIEVSVYSSNFIGNNRLIPAGPLREKFPHFSSMGCQQFNLVVNEKNKRQYTKQLVNCFVIQRKLASFVTNGKGEKQAVVELSGKKVQAITGIANSENFFTMAEQIFCVVNKTAKPDHYSFTKKDIDNLKKNKLPVVTTEKDAVKLWLFDTDIWAIPLEINIDEEFFQTILEHISKIVKTSPLQ